MIVAHTDCRMTKVTDDEVHVAIRETRAWTPAAWSSARSPISGTCSPGTCQRVRSSPYLPPDLPVLGGVYDLETGRLDILVTE